MSRAWSVARERWGRVVFVIWFLLLSLALGTTQVLTQAADDVLVNVVDFHCHSGPDSRPRSVSDIELARLARRARMRGLVFKNHYTMTADRASLAMEVVDGIEIFGGIVLNLAVGGLNVEAVQQMTRFSGGRGRVVWLPTFDAEYEVTRTSANRGYVSVVKNGELVPELHDIFQIIGENDLVLATGHSSPEEVLLILPEAQRKGVSKLVVTHVLAQEPTEAQMALMASYGAIMELDWNGIQTGRFTVSDYVNVIKTVGVRNILISSDMGQHLNPLHTDALETFIRMLRENGISDQGIDVMARMNPAALLGLE